MSLAAGRECQTLMMKARARFIDELQRPISRAFALFFGACCVNLRCHTPPSGACVAVAIVAAVVMNSDWSV
jgi:CBS-domain-containing membrane protein